MPEEDLIIYDEDRLNLINDIENDNKQYQQPEWDDMYEEVGG